MAITRATAAVAAAVGTGTTLATAAQATAITTNTITVDTPDTTKAIRATIREDTIRDMDIMTQASEAKGEGGHSGPSMLLSSVSCEVLTAVMPGQTRVVYIYHL